MNRRLLILIPTVVLILIVIGFGLRQFSNESSEVGTGDPIENLINNSLSIQYGTENIELKSVFTDELIDYIDTDYNFYKEELGPYQVVYKNFRLKEVAENEYTVSVHIEDKNGRYIQVVHIIKEGECYLISDIEYDI
jgi:hypothetical protein